MKFSLNPLSFVKSSRDSNKKIMNGYVDGVKRLGKKKHSNLIESFVEQDVDPRVLNKRIAAFQNAAYAFFGAAGLSGLMLVMAESQVSKASALAYLLVSLFGFWAMQYKAYSNYKMSDVGFWHFVFNTNDSKLFSRYRLSKKELYKIFHDAGFGEYAKERLTSKRQK